MSSELTVHLRALVWCLDTFPFSYLTHFQRIYAFPTLRQTYTSILNLSDYVHYKIFLDHTVTPDGVAVAGVAGVFTVTP